MRTEKYFNFLKKWRNTAEFLRKHRMQGLRTEALEMIRKAIRKHGKDNIGIASSFGKDSVLLIHLVRQVYPDIPIFYADTGVQYPETIEFAEKLTRQWNLNVIKVKGDISFWELADHYGLPTPDKRVCTEWLKTTPLRIKQLEMDIHTIFVGIRRDESMFRKKYGKPVVVEKYYEGATITKYHPILEWLDVDVWEYITKNNIPYNPIYDRGFDRTGCWSCTVGQNYNAVAQIEKHYPELYTKLEEYLEKDHRFKKVGDTWLIIEQNEKVTEAWIKDKVREHVLEKLDLYKGVKKWWKENLKLL